MLNEIKNPLIKEGFIILLKSSITICYILFDSVDFCFNCHIVTSPTQESHQPDEAGKVPVFQVVPSVE